MTNSKKGFTLVELSIVLVIIGLLIGGILVAQSMITTTKIQAITRQVGQFDAAVVNFRDKFNGLPGDVAAVSGLAGTAGLSDGNGIITSTGVTTLVSHSGEVGNFWRSLSISGFSTEGQGTGGLFMNSDGTGTTVAAGNLTLNGATANGPKLKGGKNNASAVGVGTGTANYYMLVTTDTVTTALTASTATNGALKPADALAVDTKIDDGVANAGTVQSGSVALAAGGGFLPTTAVASCSTTTTYTVGTTTEACVLSVRMGAQAGYLQ